MRKTCIVYNARAGAGEAWEELVRQLAGLRNLTLFPVDRPGAARELTRQALAQGYERVIAAGGDGTVSQVVNGLGPHFDRAELGIVPLGTGNDLARTLGIPLDDPEAALEIALANRVTAIDVMHVSGTSPEYCVNAATGGIGAKVAADVEAHDKVRWGAFAYWLTAVTKLIEMPEYHVQLELDDLTHNLDVYGIVIANGIFVGGGFPIAPNASIQDGLLDVTIIPILPTLELLAAGLNFTFGRHYADRVASFRSRRVHITTTPEMHFSVDGEPTRTLDTTFEALPSALRVACPLDENADK